MSEFRKVDDRGFGQYASKTNTINNINAEQLENVCHCLSIYEPLEPILRDIKKSKEKSNSASPIKRDETQRKLTQKRDKHTAIDLKLKKSPDFTPFEKFDEKVNFSGEFSKNSYSKESWGRDSGARDLSPEPNLHRAYESLDVNNQLVMDNESGGSSAMLQLASKLQVAALSALETEVIGLSERLKKSEQARDLAEKRLNEALDEKERTQRRLESVGTVHESRITEMHCVIAELNKKLKFQQENAILEDQEPEGSRSVSELSFQEGSVYNSDMECSNFEQQSQAEPSAANEHADERSESHYSMPAVIDTGGQVQIREMQEEILYLRSQMAFLQSKLASLQDSIDDDGHNIGDVQSSQKLKTGQIHGDSCEKTEISTEDKSFDRKPKQHTKMEQSLPGKISTYPIVDRQPTGQIAKSDESNKKSSETTNVKNSNVKTNNGKEQWRDNSDHEIQRLQRSIDQLRVQNSILSLSFIDTKTHCEHLYLLCSKYESNAIALNQALNLSDRTVEAYDVLLALLESKLAILENTESAIENRKAAEAVARHLMSRLENDQTMYGNSLGPWQDPTSVMCNLNSNQNIWTENDDKALREQMSKLKGQRAAVQNTVVTLESSYKEYEVNAMTQSMNTNLKLAEEIPPANRKIELETAILMDELLSIKENFSDMKHRAEQAEREKNLALEALIYLQTQLNDSEALLVMSSKERTSFTDTEHSTGIELELVEALARESRLKAQLQALAASLENATKSKIHVNIKKTK